jgi:TonB family protein
MSGRFPGSHRNYVSFAARPPAAQGRDADQSRLRAALALSCLLHAAVLALPYLGERQPEYRFALKGTQRGPYIVNATLVFKGAPGFSGDPIPAEGENVPNSSVTALDAGPQVRPDDAGASGAGLLPIPSQTYFTTDQLSKRPQPMGMAELDPIETRAIIASGRIVLKLWITERGSVTRVDVESSNLPAIFTRAAVEGFKRLRFEPGQRDGQAVGTVLRIEVDYDDGRKPPE